MDKFRLSKKFMAANVLTLSLLWFGTSHAFEPRDLIVSKEAILAAQEGLQHYLNLLADWELPYFNFHSRDEFKDAKITTPFRVFVVSPNDLLGGDPNKSLIDVVNPRPEWFFPVISNDEYRTILFVNFRDGKWKAVGIGDSDLAKSFARLMKRWPYTDGYNYIFVRNYQTRSEFIILIHPNETRVIPFPNAIAAWGLDDEKILTQLEALTLLRKSLEKIDVYKRGRLLDKWLIP